MQFTFDFIRIFSLGLYYAAPLLVTLALIIAVLGHFLGSLEGWSKFDALYQAFVTATTVGYGDVHPRRKGSKLLAIAIAFVGIIFPASWSRLRCMPPPMLSGQHTTSPGLYSSWVNKCCPVLIFAV